MLYSKFDRSLGWDNAFGGGGRLGVFVAPRLALEASAAHVSVNGPLNSNIQVVPINARVLYAVLLADQFALLLGAGYVRNNYTNTTVLSLERQRRIVLEGVNFETDSANLTDQSYVTLNRVAASLAAHPELQVEVARYTDSRGSDQYNQRLSQSRAEAVRRHLIQRGVAPERLSARGFGETNPIDTNATTNGQGRNRRVKLHRVN